MKGLLIGVFLIAHADHADASDRIGAGGLNVVDDRACVSEESRSADNVEFELASCVPPVRPILPIRPVSCLGTWTQILVNCQWVAVCIN